MQSPLSVALMSESDSQSRCGEWAYVAAGVAWVTLVVVTIPVDLPLNNTVYL